MQVVYGPGDQLIIPELMQLYGFSVSSGVEVIPIPSFIEDGFALPPISEFEKAITPRTKAIMICNPTILRVIYIQRKSSWC